MIRKKEGFEGQRSAVLPVDIINQMAMHPLCESLYLTDIGYYPNASFHDRERNKGSSEHILIYCVKGAGWYNVDGQYFEIGASQFFLLPANEPHAYGADTNDPWTIYWVHFAGLRSVDFLSFLQKGKAPLVVEPREERLRMFDDMIAHIEVSFNEDNLIYTSHALAHLLTTFKNSLYNPYIEASSGNDPVSRTIEFMKQRLDQNLTLDQLAGVANMSASHYSAVFKQKVRSAPIHFFTYLKIQKACRLLKYSAMRVREVADQVGYPDPYHFSRVFTGVMGVSPREFRRSDSSQPIDKHTAEY